MLIDSLTNFLVICRHNFNHMNLLIPTDVVWVLSMQPQDVNVPHQLVCETRQKRKLDVMHEAWLVISSSALWERSYLIGFLFTLELRRKCGGVMNRLLPCVVWTWQSRHSSVDTSPQRNVQVVSYTACVKWVWQPRRSGCRVSEKWSRQMNPKGLCTIWQAPLQTGRLLIVRGETHHFRPHWILYIAKNRERKTHLLFGCGPETPAFSFPRKTQDLCGSNQWLGGF